MEAEARIRDPAELDVIHASATTGIARAHHPDLLGARNLVSPYAVRVARLTYADIGR